MTNETTMTESEKMTCKAFVERIDNIKQDLKLALSNVDELFTRYNWDGAYIDGSWRVYAELIELAQDAKNELAREAAK